MSRLANGVDIRSTRTKMGLVDLEAGQVLKLLISPTGKKDADKFLQTIAAEIAQFKDFVMSKQAILLGAGFGVSSFVFENGVVDSTYGFLKFMEDYPLADLIEKYCLLSCRVDNDARVVALGESSLLCIPAHRPGSQGPWQENFCLPNVKFYINQVMQTI